MSTADTYVRARIDTHTKERAAEALGAMGLSISDAIRLLMLRVADERRLPFEIKVPSAIAEEKNRPVLPVDRSQQALALLGVSPGATSEVIKTAYRKKANQYHPDKNPSPDAAARFREVQEAYEVLSDETRRKAYDDNRRRSLIDDPQTVAQDIWKTYLSDVVNS